MRLGRVNKVAASAQASQFKTNVFFHERIHQKINSRVKVGKQISSKHSCRIDRTEPESFAK